MLAMDHRVELVPRKFTVPNAGAVQRGDDGAEAGQVQERPEDRGDHPGDAVGQEERQPEEPPEPDGHRVQQQREDRGEHQHHRDLDHAEQQHPGQALQELGVGEDLGVVGQAGELRGGRVGPEPETRDVHLEEALVDRVPDRQQEEQREQHAERGQERPGRPAGPAPAAQPAPRPGGRRAAGSLDGVGGGDVVDGHGGSLVRSRSRRTGRGRPVSPPGRPERAQPDLTEKPCFFIARWSGTASTSAPGPASRNCCPWPCRSRPASG